MFQERFHQLQGLWLQHSIPIDVVGPAELAELSLKQLTRMFAEVRSSATTSTAYSAMLPVQSLLLMDNLTVLPLLRPPFTSHSALVSVAHSKERTPVSSQPGSASRGSSPHESDQGARR